MSEITNAHLEANRITQTIVSALDHVGACGDWRGCPSTHCERAEECRSPHECSGRNRAILSAQIKQVIVAVHQQITTLTDENERLRHAAEVAMSEAATKAEDIYILATTRSDCLQIEVSQLRAALKNLVDIDDMDNRTDPDLAATDAWREEAMNIARHALKGNEP